MCDYCTTCIVVAQVLARRYLNIVWIYHLFCYSRTPHIQRIGEEPGNPHDPLAVAFLQQIDGHDTIVGHVPQRTLASCCVFISSGDIIQSTITGSRRYNVDLIQGGFEVLCKLRFILNSSQEFCKDRDFDLFRIISNCYIFFREVNFHDSRTQHYGCRY